MEFVEGLILFTVYVVVIAAVAMMTPRIGNGIAALAGIVSGRKGKMAAGQADAH